MIGLLVTSLLLAQPPAPAPQTPPPASHAAEAPTLAPPSEAPPAAPAPAVPALLAAQLEVHQLRSQLYLQLLQVERDRLTAAVAAALPGYRVDWDTWRLVRAEPAAAAAPTKDDTP